MRPPEHDVRSPDLAALEFSGSTVELPDGVEQSKLRGSIDSFTESISIFPSFAEIDDEGYTAPFPVQVSEKVAKLRELRGRFHGYTLAYVAVPCVALTLLSAPHDKAHCRECRL
eukprot:TRINITY_DN24489_c0_g1_i3.p1 TRINITY_DN24489_c0_g1~~TRINITY_DN24489_c0_g1_i3.p1  ORF type:complete len:114 (+),score=18.39 TRINITY_DN24489_c0_g1_i3:127-468(+)